MPLAAEEPPFPTARLSTGRANFAQLPPLEDVLTSRVNRAYKWTVSRFWQHGLPPAVPVPSSLRR